MALEIQEIGELGDDNSPTIILTGSREDLKQAAKLFGEKVELVKTQPKESE